MADALYIAAKAPRVGEVKTRLGRAIGHEAATALYRAFLSDLGRRFAEASVPPAWFVTPAAGWEAVRAASGAPPRSRVLDQGPGDWTERQRRLLHGARARGEERVVLISSDSPHLRPETVDEAFAALSDHDVVLGPTLDGGYYLIAMRGWHDVLRGVSMSTRDVLADVERTAADMGVSVSHLAPTFDVDEAADLEALRAELAMRDDLPATEAALRALDAAAARPGGSTRVAVTSTERLE